MEAITRIKANVDLLALLRDRLGIVPDYENLLEQGYRRLVRKGDTVVDVGAHQGRHTAVLADLVGTEGRVLAFEPLPEFAQQLQQTLPSPPAKVISAALSDKAGESSFIRARGVPSESGLIARRYNFPERVTPETISVRVDRLDAYLPELAGLSFIKIDAEGAEVAILNGGRTVVETLRPLVAVEYGAGSYEAYGLTRSSLFSLARSVDYVIGDLFGALCDDEQTWLQVCDVSCWDWFLVPRERSAEWQKAVLRAVV
jgi:FkbM family methyltransferase